MSGKKARLNVYIWTNKLSHNRYLAWKKKEKKQSWKDVCRRHTAIVTNWFYGKSTKQQTKKKYQLITSKSSCVFRSFRSQFQYANEREREKRAECGAAQHSTHWIEWNEIKSHKFPWKNSNNFKYFYGEQKQMRRPVFIEVLVIQRDGNTNWLNFFISWYSAFLFSSFSRCLSLASINI